MIVLHIVKDIQQLRGNEWIGVVLGVSVGLIAIWVISIIK